MHEFGYCEGVIAAVERRAAGRRVARIGVRIGAVHRVVPAAFEQSFQLAAAGGVADGATTEVAIIPVHADCRSCGADFTSPDPAPACPQCGALEVTVDGGDEVVLEWVEYHPGEGAPDGTPVMATAGSHVAERA